MAVQCGATLDYLGASFAPAQGSGQEIHYPSCLEIDHHLSVLSLWGGAGWGSRDDDPI
jgi:hypothetical protein